MRTAAAAVKFNDARDITSSLVIDLRSSRAYLSSKMSRCCPNQGTRPLIFFHSPKRYRLAIPLWRLQSMKLSSILFASVLALALAFSANGASAAGASDNSNSNPSGLAARPCCCTMWSSSNPEECIQNTCPCPTGGAAVSGGNPQGQPAGIAVSDPGSPSIKKKQSKK